MSKEKIVVQQNTYEQTKISESVKEVVSGRVISEENKKAEIELKKQKEEENNKKIEEIRNDLLNNTEVGSINNKESYLNPEKKEELIVVFKKLKEILEKKEISQEVKDLFQSGDVLGVITGIKPASYIQPQMEKSILGIIKQRNGLSLEDLRKFQEILKNFNIDYKIMEGGDDYKRSKEIKDFKNKNGIELIHIYNQKRALDVMKSSNLFSSEEINLAERDMGIFLSSYLSKSNNMDWDKVYRVGVLYGYPLDDVKISISSHVLFEKYKKIGLSKENINLALEKESLDILSKIEKNDLEIFRKHKNAKGVNIKGIKSGIQWSSFNPEIPEVQNKIKEMQEVLDMSRELLA